MNFETAKKSINNDYVNLFLAKYLKAQWGITVGYSTQPEYLALMRKKLADYQEQYDCCNELCAESRATLSCPPGYTLVASAGVSSLLSPTTLSALTAGTPVNGQVCVIATCNACPPVTPRQTVEVIEYGTLADPGTCVLPPLSAYGPGCGRCGWPMNVNDILIGTFSR